MRLRRLFNRFRPTQDSGPEIARLAGRVTGSSVPVCVGVLTTAPAGEAPAHG
jgi:hypothetical protein